MRYDYWYFPKVYSHEDLIEIHDIFEKTSDSDGVDLAATSVTKKAKVKLSHWFNFKDKLNSLEQAFLRINQDHFGYNIWNQFDNNYIRLNEYSSDYKGEYDWHTDGSPDKSAYDIKFTLLINSSLQSYEGGRFYLFTTGGSQHIDKLDNPGDVIIIKSHIPHRVSPVTKGVRHTITLFYSGPKFQ
tara:strand:+ start:21 stop:575 length:555 start_codon:yes stop_codon:yes gene_type:complete